MSSLAESRRGGIAAATHAPRIGDPVDRLDPSIRQRDYLRGRGRADTTVNDYKEWLHYCVLGDSAELLFNFSVCDDAGRRSAKQSPIARVTVLARDEKYIGDVDAFFDRDVRAPAGVIDLAFGHNRLRYSGGAYHVTLALQNGAVAAEVELRPRVTATLAPNIPLPDGPPLQWAIVPRLEAFGWMRVGDREHRFDGAPTYHDHNWGRFLWGHGFSWIWGFCLPDDPDVPWAVVFVRLANRQRTCTLAQGLFVWRRADVSRIFRERDLRFDLDFGFLRPRRVVKVPPVMGLVLPDTATDVPRWVEMHADGEGDRLAVRFELLDLAQVVIPSETDLGTTIINEVTGKARVEGCIRGETIAFGARGMCEFLGS